MTTDSDNIQKVKVLSKTTWTPNLFSFTVTRPDSFKFTAGQFVRLGVNPSRLKYHQDQANSEAADEDIYRAYSIVSSHYDETLEFFSIVIPDGAFTSQLQHLQVGDEPFLSMLQDLKTWEDYEHIILAYSARNQQELAYVDRIKTLAEDFGGLVESPAKFTFIPIVTREEVEGALTKRLPELLLSGELENFAGQKLATEHTHIMLCGNPEMVEDTKETLKDMGLIMNRRGVGNIAVENYW